MIPEPIPTRLFEAEKKFADVSQRAEEWRGDRDKLRTTRQRLPWWRFIRRDSLLRAENRTAVTASRYQAEADDWARWVDVWKCIAVHA